MTQPWERAIAHQQESIQRDLELGKIRLAKLEQTAEERAWLPFKMERPFHRIDYNNGKLTIHFEDAAHLANAWTFAEKHKKGVDFERAMMKLIRVALGGAIPRRSTNQDEPDAWDYAGRERKITIYPDSLSEPSFGWHEEKGMVGGLIWHHRSGDWSIHT
jgi:hypothetical protein